MGRPSDFSEDTLNEICDRLSKGEPLAVICREERMPTDRTVRNWMQSRPEVFSAIACARELGFDAIAHNARLTARGQGDSKNDVQRDKLIIDTDLKLLSKWDPRRYGETTHLKHTGGDPGDPPIKTENKSRLNLEGLSVEQLRALASIPIQPE